MKYLEEFNDPAAATRILDDIARNVHSEWSIMEVCGGQTHTIIRNGIDQLLPGAVTLIHGPGCPVCVTPLEMIDRALAIAARPGVIFCTFGDMARVPGSHQDLLQVKAAGGDVRLVYSPLDAVKLAKENPDRQVVFFAIGFETTAPANAMTVVLAKQQGLRNFSLLVSHVLVPPAMSAILDAPNCRVQGFLAAGHVCTVMGMAQYEPFVENYHVPIVVTGFEPLDVLEGIRRVLFQLEEGQARLENAYSRAVTFEGNRPAQKIIEEVFQVCDRQWRGIGMIPQSGWRLSDAYMEFDAEQRFDVGTIVATESELCHSGEVLRGNITPPECPSFGVECSPRNPLGAPMVSSEGACAAYYQFRRIEVLEPIRR